MRRWCAWRGRLLHLRRLHRRRRRLRNILLLQFRALCLWSLYLVTLQLLPLKFRARRHWRRLLRHRWRLLKRAAYRWLLLRR